MGVVNVHVTSLPSVFPFTHNMKCEKLVTNWFIGYSDRKRLEYIILIPKDIGHVKR